MSNRKLHKMLEGDRITHWFWCPGCNHLHLLDQRWTITSYDPPTVQGSYLQYGSNPELEGGIPRCHLFITNGKLQYLNDCSHALANQTIDMPDLPEWFLNPHE